MRKQQGFGQLELLIAVLLIGVVGFSGYMVYKRNNKVENSASSVTFNDHVATENLSVAHNQFGFNVLKSLADKTDKNIMISPTSIAMSLSMAYNGANGETKTAMQKVLSLEKLNLDQTNGASQKLISDINSADIGVEVNIANSLWVDKGFKVKDGALSLIKEKYSAQAQTLDFKNKESVATINNWVNEKTKQKIPTIIDSIAPESKMFLINAVYFKGDWTTKFEKNSTEKNDFVINNGKKIKTDFMQRYGKMSYAKTDSFEAVNLPYGKQKQVSMYLLKPKSDVNSFIKNMDAAMWTSYVSKFSEKKGNLKLPKFKLSYDVSLNNTLKAIGMNIAFDPGADFSGFAKGIFITEVKHKTFIDVNESGTEATAVTSVNVGTTSAFAEPVDTFDLSLDKPFYYAIVDSKSGSILFSGILNNPLSE